MLLEPVGGLLLQPLRVLPRPVCLVVVVAGSPVWGRCGCQQCHRAGRVRHCRPVRVGALSLASARAMPAPPAMACAPQAPVVRVPSASNAACLKDNAPPGKPQGKDLLQASSLPWVASDQGSARGGCCSRVHVLLALPAVAPAVATQEGRDEKGESRVLDAGARQDARSVRLPRAVVEGWPRGIARALDVHAVPVLCAVVLRGTEAKQEEYEGHADEINENAASSAYASSLGTSVPRGRAHEARPGHVEAVPCGANQLHRGHILEILIANGYVFLMRVFGQIQHARTEERPPMLLEVPSVRFEHAVEP